ncbi:MAG: lipopolysaccharide transport periplasmic protein LptA [Nitrospinota bacterium]
MRGRFAASKRLTVLLALAALLAPVGGAPALAQKPDRVPSVSEGFLQKEAAKTQVPIHIVSDRMVADNKNLWVHFVGNVTATRGNLVIHSDRLEVYRDSKTQRIDRIEAVGRVDISQEGRYATAEKAIYYDIEQKIVLLGNPRAWENDNIIVGHQMNIFLKTDRLIVEGSSNRRVDVVLYPPKEKERDQGRGASDRDKAPAPPSPRNGGGSRKVERAARD